MSLDIQQHLIQSLTHLSSVFVNCLKTKQFKNVFQPLMIQLLQQAKEHTEDFIQINQFVHLSQVQRVYFTLSKPNSPSIDLIPFEQLWHLFYASVLQTHVSQDKDFHDLFSLYVEPCLALFDPIFQALCISMNTMASQVSLQLAHLEYFGFNPHNEVHLSFLCSLNQKGVELPLEVLEHMFRLFFDNTVTRCFSTFEDLMNLFPTWNPSQALKALTCVLHSPVDLNSIQTEKDISSLVRPKNEIEKLYVFQDHFYFSWLEMDTLVTQLDLKFNTQTKTQTHTFRHWFSTQCRNCVKLSFF